MPRIARLVMFALVAAAAACSQETPGAAERSNLSEGEGGVIAIGVKDSLPV